MRREQTDKYGRVVRESVGSVTLVCEDCDYRNAVNGMASPSLTCPKCGGSLQTNGAGTEVR